jgi:hypothetical protein
MTRLFDKYNLGLIFLSFFFSTALFAQKTGSISGIILQKNTQQALFAATINISGTSINTTSDSTGRFRLLNIPVKTYNVLITSVGYKTNTIYNVVVSSGNENVYTIELENNDAKLQEVIIKSNKRSVSETKKKFVASNQNWKCDDCKEQLKAWFEVDHIKRLDQGGSNDVDNLVALCRNCHGKKTSMENI